MRDWNCWHNDYYMKVLQCATRTIKTIQKRKCGKFKVCKKYCKSNYGVSQCRVRCRFKRNSVPKFLKVIYSVKRNGLCSDNAICLYESKCNSMWPQYIQIGCYYTYDFNEWWKIHKKEYVVQKYPSKPLEVNKTCTDDGPVKSKLETTVKVRTRNGRLYFKMGQVWIHVRFQKGKLFYKIGRKWINVKFKYNHQYFKIGDKWIRVVVANKRIYAKLASLWAPIKVLFGGFFIKLGAQWSKWKIIHGRLFIKPGRKWIEFLILDKDVYYKFNKYWYKIRHEKFNLLIKLGDTLRKIIIINGKRYIQLGTRWFEFNPQRKKYLLKVNKSWRRVYFKNKRIFIEINNYKYPIRFRSVYIFIKVKRQWVRMEGRKAKLFFRLNDSWVHLKLKAKSVFVKKEDTFLKVYINDEKKLFYEFEDTTRKVPVVLKNLDITEKYSLENFYYGKMSERKKLFGGYWLRFKKKGEHYLYKLFEKWVRLNFSNGKVYIIKDNMNEYEIRILGKSVLLKVNKTWIEIKRMNKKLFFRDSRKWIRVMLKDNKIYVRLMNKWIHISFKNGRKYLRYGKIFRQIRLKKGSDDGFYIKLGDQWYDIKYNRKKIFLRVKTRWVQLKLHQTGNMEIRLHQKWFQFKVKKNKSYLKLGEKWRQFLVRDQTVWIKIGDTFMHLKISKDDKIFIYIKNVGYEFDGENIVVNGERIKINFLKGKLHQYFQKRNIPLKIVKNKMFIKVQNSWIERRIDRKNKYIIIIVKNQKIKLTYDKGILCELFYGETIPVRIRFKRLYYNLNGKWVQITLRKNKRIALLNGRKISLKKIQIRRLIKKYKVLKQSKCKTISSKRYIKAKSIEEDLGISKRIQGERQKSITLERAKRRKLFEIERAKNIIITPEDNKSKEYERVTGNVRERKKYIEKTWKEISILKYKVRPGDRRYVTIRSHKGKPSYRYDGRSDIRNVIRPKHSKRQIHLITGKPIKSQLFLKKIKQRGKRLPFKTFTSNNVRYVTINKVNLPLKVKGKNNFIKWNDEWYLIIVYEDIVYIYIDQFWTVAVITKDKILTQVNNKLKPLLVRQKYITKITGKIYRLDPGDRGYVRRRKFSRIVNREGSLPKQFNLAKIHRLHKSLPFKTFTDSNKKYVVINNVNVPLKIKNNDEYIQVNDDWYMVLEYEDNVYLNINGYWTIILITEHGIATLIDTEWLCFKTIKEKPYVKLVDTFIEIKRVRNEVYYRFGDLWVKIKKVKSKLYMKIYKKWLKITMYRHKIFLLMNSVSYQMKFTGKQIYYKIYNRWIETKEEKGKSYFKFNKVWKRATLRTGKPQIKIIDIWYEYKYINEKLYLKIRNTWRQVECHFNKLYLFINKKKFLVKFENKKILIQLFIKWVETKFKKDKTLIKVGNIFLPIQIDGGKIQFLIEDDWKNILWKEGNFYYMVDDIWVLISESPAAVSNEPILFRNGKQLYRMNDKELPLKRIKSNLFYMLKKKWILIKFKKDRQFHKIGDRLIETRLVIRKLYYKFGKSWLPIDIVDSASFDIIFDDQRVHIQDVNGYWEIKVFNKWFKLRLSGDNVFYNLDGKWIAIKVNYGKLQIDTKPSNYIFDIGSYLMLDGDWVKLSVKNNEYYYVLSGKMIKSSWNAKEATVRINARNLNVKRVKDKNVIKIGEEWFEFKPIDENYILILVFNKWETIGIKRGKLYLKRGKRQYRIRFNEEKKVFIRINKKFYLMKFGAKYLELFIDGHWFEVLTKDDHLYFVKENQTLRIRFINGKMHLKMGAQWIESKLIEGNFWILIGGKWTKFELHNGKKYITKGGRKLGIKFSGSKTFIEVGEDWYLLKIEGDKYYIEVDGTWIHFIIDGGLEYIEYGGKRLTVKFDKKIKYMLIGKKWKKFKLINGKYQIYLNDEWTLFEVYNKKEYLILKGRKVRFQYFNGHSHVKIGSKWFQYNVIKGEYYLLIEKLWTKFKVEHEHIFIYYGEMAFKFRVEKGDLYIEIGDRWVKYRVLDSNIQIWLGAKWNLIKIIKGELILIKRGLNLKIKFENGRKYIFYLNKWFKFKIKKSLFYVFVDGKWVIVSFIKQKKYLIVISSMMNNPIVSIRKEINAVRKYILRDIEKVPLNPVIISKQPERTLIEQPVKPSVIKIENPIVVQPEKLNIVSSEITTIKSTEKPQVVDLDQQIIKPPETISETEVRIEETNKEPNISGTEGEHWGRWRRRRHSRRWRKRHFWKRRRHSRKWRRHSRRYKIYSRRWGHSHGAYSGGLNLGNIETGDVESIQSIKSKKVIRDQAVLSQLKEFRTPLPFQPFMLNDKQYVKINNVDLLYKSQDNDNYISWADNWYMIIFFNDNVYMNINGFWTAVYFTETGVLTEEDGKWVLLQQDPTTKALIRRETTALSSSSNVEVQTVISNDRGSEMTKLFLPNTEYRVYSRRTETRYSSDQV